MTDRVGEITGDRLCTRCGFNLIGQPITRENELLLARCPECGTPAALQEYPLLGRWATRMAMLLGAAWLLIVLSAIVVGGTALYGAARGIAWSVNQPLSTHIANAYLDDVVARARTGQPPIYQNDIQLYDWLRRIESQVRSDEANPTDPLPPAAEISDEAVSRARTQLTYWLSVDEAWWEMQDASSYLRSSGGMRAALAEITWRAWFMLLFPSLLFGALAAVTMSHYRRLRLLPLALLPVGVAALAGAAFGFEGSSWGTAIEVDRLAARMLWMPTLAIVLTAGFLGIACGMLLGRSMGRITIRLLLPPRARGPFAFLWLCDGLTPPSTRS